MPKLAVLGHPVAHSRSPAMHTAALEHMGLGGDWSYEAIDVAPERFEEAVREVAAGDFAGVNVTVPHKAAALALADRATDAARAIGAANTLSFASGQIVAENTDATGLLEALGSDPSGAEALILGAGGSARACAWALRGAGAHVRIHNRTASRARDLARDIGVGVAEAELGGVSLDGIDLLINTTTVGLESANRPSAGRPSSDEADLKALGVDADALGEGMTVIDLVYGRRPTALITAASKKEARTIEGIEVLVAQGAASLRIWTGIAPPIDVMARAARAST